MNGCSSNCNLIKKNCKCQENISLNSLENIQYFKCFYCNKNICDKCEFNFSCNHCFKSFCNDCNIKHKKSINKKTCYFCKKIKVCFNINISCSEEYCFIIHSKNVCLSCCDTLNLKNTSILYYNQKKRFDNIQYCKYSNNFYCGSHTFKCKICTFKYNINFKKNKLNVCNLCFYRYKSIITLWKKIMYKPNSKFVNNKLKNRFINNFHKIKHMEYI